MTPYERVQLSRQRTAATFPLPSVLDCIRYAITELAEYDDALLRAERQGDKRNNDKAHDARGELGQALYMLLSAAVQLSYRPIRNGRKQKSIGVDYADALFSLANILAWMRHEECGDLDRYQRNVLQHTAASFDTAYLRMCRIAESCGWNVDALVDDACAKFEAKHAPVEVAR
jgi:hypothetical protein